MAEGPLPLCGFVEGDSMGVLVFAAIDMPLAEVARRLLTSASVRIEPGSPEDWELHVAERAVPMGTAETETVGDAHLAALDRIDLRRRA
ncbi:MAG: hypothetical protein S0880_28205 [Actinomycetota bacterium]|nr:hypothetical protein [Actinomycetota bacterium]